MAAHGTELKMAVRRRSGGNRKCSDETKQWWERQWSSSPAIPRFV